MIDYENYDRDLKLARLWWRELSINEMKAFVAKYCPAFYLDSLPPSFLIDIYKKEILDIEPQRLIK
jgi:hypothetical protein